MPKLLRALLVGLVALLLAVGTAALTRQAEPVAPRFDAASSSALPDVLAPVRPKPAAKPKPKPKPVVKPRPVVQPKPRPAATLTPRTHTSPVPAPTAAPTSGSAQQRMMAAVARIPGAETAHWFLIAQDGYWGTADWYHNAIYVSPTVPANRIYDVVAHEWAHLLSVKVYGNVDQAIAAMNAWFGGSGVQGSERAADCMAKQLGATWTHYTPCTDPSWQSGGATLLAGQRL